MMEGVEISFNVDVEMCREVGVDPTTSEGKARIRRLVLEALERHGEQREEKLDDVDAALVEAFLGEE
jgi:hypothetical protein